MIDQIWNNEVFSNLKLINLDTNKILINDSLPLYEGSIRREANKKDCTINFSCILI